MSVKARIYLIIIGAILIAVGAIVLIRDKSLDTELLGTGAAIDGIACVIASLTGLNGKS